MEGLVGTTARIMAEAETAETEEKDDQPEKEPIPRVLLRGTGSLSQFAADERRRAERKKRDRRRKKKLARKRRRKGK